MVVDGWCRLGLGFALLTVASDGWRRLVLDGGARRGQIGAGFSLRYPLRPRVWGVVTAAPRTDPVVTSSLSRRTGDSWSQANAAYARAGTISDQIASRTSVVGP
jgi:hypothetical protein